MLMKRNYVFWHNISVFVQQHKGYDKNIAEDNFWKERAGEFHDEKLLRLYAKFAQLFKDILFVITASIC